MRVTQSSMKAGISNLPGSKAPDYLVVLPCSHRATPAPGSNAESEAIRRAGSDPDFFEYSYVTATRAVFASLKIEAGWSPLPEVIQVVWLGFDEQGVPHWGADYGALLGPCESSSQEIGWRPRADSNRRSPP